MTAEPEGDLVWVIDSSALIATKTSITASLQWSFFERLKLMVHNGAVCFPKAVKTELVKARHVDTPEAWALDVCKSVVYSYQPLDATVGRVMLAAGDVIDPDSEGDPADPYVLAQALEIQESDRRICVVTNDTVDHIPLKIAMSSACTRLGLSWCELTDFMTAVQFDPKQGWLTPAS